MSIILATGFTEGYSYAEPYLQSLVEHSNVPLQVFSVGFDKAGCSWVPENDMPKQMLQAGHFADYMLESNNPVVLFTDADIVMQRPFLPDELQFLEGLGENDVAIGMNQTYYTTLEEEWRSLFPTRTAEEMDNLFPGWRNYGVWNTGAVAARLSTWRDLRAAYDAIRPELDPAFEHYARVQWGICYVVGKQFKHVELPGSIHRHGHLGLPPDVTMADGKAHIGNKLVVLSHRL